jgi:hypothetical protein
MGRKPLTVVLRKLWKIPLMLMSLKLNEPKVLFTTAWCTWQMRKEIRVVRDWTTLTASMLTAHGATKEAVTCKLCDRVMHDLMQVRRPSSPRTCDAHA